jgi:hypothetical protein
VFDCLLSSTRSKIKGKDRKLKHFFLLFGNCKNVKAAVIPLPGAADKI